MGIVLARVDQRLVHGIVVTQVFSTVKAQRIMVVDNEVSKDESRKSAMRLSKPAGSGMSIIDVESAISNFQMQKYDNHNVLLVVQDISVLIELIEAGISIPLVQVGILLDRDDREKITTHVALSDVEKAQLKRIEELGVPVIVQRVPSDKPEPLSKFNF